MSSEQQTIVEEMVVPLFEERIIIGKRAFDRERVSITTKVTQREASADLEIVEDHVEIERIAIDREVDSAPDVRVENDVMVVPVVKEVLVKRLVLVEEVRLRRVKRPTSVSQPIMLRSMEAIVDREILNQETKV